MKNLTYKYNSKLQINGIFLFFHSIKRIKMNL